MNQREEWTGTNEAEEMKMFEIDDPKEIKTRLNDHVLVAHQVTEEGQEWRDEEKEYRANAVYQVYVVLTLGDTSVTYYIMGELLEPLEEWRIMDIYFDVGVPQDKVKTDAIVYQDFENLNVGAGIPLKREGNESLRTWIKEFREKAGV